jgi:O-antigen ligase
LLVVLALVLMLVVFGDLRFTTPGWMWLAPIGVVLCTAIRWFDPVPYQNLVQRMGLPPYGPDYFFRGAIWMVALVVVPVVVIACTGLDARVPQLLVGAFTAGVCVSATVAILDVVGLTSFGQSLGTAGVTARQAGLSTHSNMLGFSCVIAIPFAVYFLTAKRHRWLSGIALVLLLGGVLLSGSRAAQAGSALVLLMALLVAPNKKAAVRDASIVLGIAAVLGGALVQIKSGNIFDNLLRFGSSSTTAAGADEERTMLFNQAVKDFWDFPVAGVGMKSIVNAHNIYLQLLSAGGLVLTVAVLAYWICVLHAGYVSAKSGNLLARYLSVSVIAWLTLGLVSTQITDRFLYYSIGCIAALSVYRLGWRKDDELSAAQAALSAETSDGAARPSAATTTARRP